MANQADSPKCRALLDPAFNYHAQWAWGSCPTCIDSNPDIAGIGVIIGIVGQAFLMSLAVLGWWFLATPHKWYLRLFRRTQQQRLRSWSARRGARLQRVLFMAADTQAVTGIALTIAGLIQIPTMPLFHIAVILDLLSISANGQAVMLLYGLRSRESNGRVDLRLLVSVVSVSLYFAFAGLAFQRFRALDAGPDCLLNYPPQVGNYGEWGLAEASLMLLIYVFAYAQDLAPSLRHRLEDRNPPVLFLWMYDGFLPVFTITYFVWNLVDLIGLKVANRAILNDDAENKIDAFGQVVPIVLLLLVILSLWDLWTSEEEKREGEHVDDVVLRDR